MWVIVSRVWTLNGCQSFREVVVTAAEQYLAAYWVATEELARAHNLGALLSTGYGKSIPLGLKPSNM